MVFLYKAAPRPVHEDTGPPFWDPVSSGSTRNSTEFKALVNFPISMTSLPTSLRDAPSASRHLSSQGNLPGDKFIVSAGLCLPSSCMCYTDDDVIILGWVHASALALSFTCGSWSRPLDLITLVLA